MVEGLAEDLKEIRGRLNGLLWMVAGAIVLDVVMRSLRVGHRFPGGVMDAQDAWIEVTVHDARGKLVAEAGERTVVLASGCVPCVNRSGSISVVPICARTIASASGGQTLSPHMRTCADFEVLGGDHEGG